ncbi:MULTISPECIES: accessory factor UbiK family protein [Chromobacterium]|uniref:Ubiquinone biosynthesis accessory factor UbiK n=2 Tax=Chromobacterium TaxID=535 RepID=A0A2K4MRL0_9NEIS|nr:MULTISPECIES: accessory factor UbiK family protein [Chromobacterium]KIA82265.1 phosphoheptose isomerase [Chromobacterium piscinae]MBM2882807.1 accessory factor UbiK family protein [Chromobacterium amazonense]MDE1713157.1 accessory factor UbiK family protein [Chromobacterium amazonense]OHX17479.1 phosphoheptose isomerase [Chromobacterium amazonense]POA99677.1 phosphoheptose isomerase [Chromobacterium sinusclupearum]
MLSQKLFDEISAKISETIAASPAKDLEKNIRAMMASTFSKMDLVTREEFDVQQAVLARTREQLAALESRLGRLESQVFPEESAAKAEAQSELGHS